MDWKCFPTLVLQGACLDLLTTRQGMSWGIKATFLTNSTYFLSPTQAQGQSLYCHKRHRLLGL